MDVTDHPWSTTRPVLCRRNPGRNDVDRSCSSSSHSPHRRSPPLPGALPRIGMRLPIGQLLRSWNNFAPFGSAEWYGFTFICSPFPSERRAWNQARTFARFTMEHLPIGHTPMGWIDRRTKARRDPVRALPNWHASVSTGCPVRSGRPLR